MIPIPFHENERVLSPPSGQHKEIAGLRVVDIVCDDGTPAVVSCWQLSADEIAAVTQTGRIYHVVMGTTHAPVFLTTNPSNCGMQPKP